MNWDAIGAIAELLSAVAVFVTLVYLALQIRQNTRAVRSSAVDASINSVIDVRGLMIQDSEMADIFLRGNSDPDSLDRTENFRYWLMLQNVTWSAWNVYSQAKDFETGVWKSQEFMVRRIFSTPGGKRFFDEYQEVLDSDFKFEIERMLGDKSDL